MFQVFQENLMGRINAHYVTVIPISETPQKNEILKKTPGGAYGHAKKTGSPALFIIGTGHYGGE